MRKVETAAAYHQKFRQVEEKTWPVKRKLLILRLNYSGKLLIEALQALLQKLASWNKNLAIVILKPISELFNYNLR